MFPSMIAEHPIDVNWGTLSTFLIVFFSPSSVMILTSPLPYAMVNDPSASFTRALCVVSRAVKNLRFVVVVYIIHIFSSYLKSHMVSDNISYLALTSPSSFWLTPFRRLDCESNESFIIRPIVLPEISVIGSV